MVDSSRPQSGAPRENLSGSSAPSIRIHPYDLFTILDRLTREELLIADKTATIDTVEVNGVRYIEDTSIMPSRRMDLEGW
jgi:hypothetical protein